MQQKKRVSRFGIPSSFIWLPTTDYKLIASEGQTPAHAPHSMHLSASIT